MPQATQTRFLATSVPCFPFNSGEVALICKVTVATAQHKAITVALESAKLHVMCGVNQIIIHSH